MSFKIQRSAQRYYANHDWLRTYHSFSFADYYDPANMNWGALRVFNDDYIAAAQGFPPHPHRDMEILTYVFSGELEHQDSMGNRGVVKAGGVQFMSAGTGVRHSELNASSESELHLAQMWVLPGRTGTAPTYGQVDFTEADRRGRWLIVASGQDGVESPIALTQSATLRVAQLNGEELQHRFDDGRKGFLFVWDGSIQANGESLGAGDAVRIDATPQIAVSGTGELVFWDVPSI
ncbi:MAG TPA: pirin family protein [Candidatus Baltobacteraceae bacterium]|nr:pirin family protein [Candidatus Baltobacteraceae bacterium]